MKKLKFTSLCFAISSLAVSVGIGIKLNKSDSDEVDASSYSVNSVPTTIDLNDATASTIRNYYSSLNSLTSSRRQGTNLLKNLKPILKKNQTYYSYGSSATTAVWQVYEIIDRDWDKSPASAISGYNSNTNIITGYTYGTSNSNVGTNPYIHALYVNRNVTNQTRAWGNHNQDQWGINQEHVWAKSCGFNDNSPAAGARGDVMHLWAGNGKVNGTYHSNYYYGYVDKTKSYDNAGSYASTLSGNLKGKSKTKGGSYTVFEPQDSDKGDIARAIFYMAARYNYLSGSDSDGIDAGNPNLEITNELNWAPGTSYQSSTTKKGQMGILQDLLEWNRLDPPDAWEIHRNNLCYNNFTHNRNPFIDFPEWAEFIWGKSVDGSYSSSVTGYATPSSDTINDFSSGGGGDTVSVTGVSLNTNSTSVEAGKDVTLTATVSPSNATNKNVSWSTSNANIATVSGGTITGVAEGNATITVTTSDGGFTATCSVAVTPSSGGGGESTDDGSASASDITSSSDWTKSGTGTYSGGDLKLDTTGDYISNSSLFASSLSSNMSSLTVTINGKWNSGSGDSSTNSYKVEAIDSSGNVLATQTKTGSDVFNGSLGDVEFSFDSDLTGCAGIKITYANKGNGNWQIHSVSWSAVASGSSEATLSSIAVKTVPSKVTYTAGEYFDATGLVITATYSDSSTEDISFDDNSDLFEFDPNEELHTSDVSVTIYYGGKSTTQAITVNPAVPTSITATVSKSYYVGQTISKSDITVKDNNNNTISQSDFDFANDGYQFTYSDAASGGANTNKTFSNSVTYGNLSCSLTVVVSRKARSLDPVTNSITYTDLPTTYQTSKTERTAASGIKFIAYNLANYSSKMQFKASGGYLESTEALGLTSITINNRETNALTVYGSNTAGSFSTTITGTNDVYDLSGYSYFKIMKNGSGAAYCSSISITYSGTETAVSLSNYVMYEDTANQCTTKLNTAIGYLHDMSSSERTTFQTSNDYVVSTARERLEAWARHLGKTIDYSNGTVSGAKTIDVINGGLSTPILILVVVSAVGTICIGGYFFRRKEK